jgi:hypothetical protein
MFLNSYYFRAHMYTILPRHVREDMEWMAGIGTDAVTIALLEQDLFAAAENVDIICSEAERAGMKVFITPSRWGGLVAGAPKVPSIFSATNPEAMMQNADGSPLIDWLGPKASVHHPATLDLFRETLDNALLQFPIAGVVWDEIKVLGDKDYSPAAREALAGSDIEDLQTHIDATAEFFEHVNAGILEARPNARLCMFVYAQLSGYAVRRLARIRHLHDFGCDGRPFAAEDAGADDSGDTESQKLLCEHGPYFVEIAKENGKRPLFLIENHAMRGEDVATMDRRLPEILAMGAEHIIYYYYPRSLNDPDANMAVIAEHMKAAKG